MKRNGKISFYGFLNIDKPSGLTSSTLVNKCKWLSGVPCGHMGTLDPLASGVLPVGLGNATRLFDYFLEKDKEYIAKFTFGVMSDTLDSTGELTKIGRIPTAEEIQSVLPSLVGDVMQIPPKYSAKNINGQRGYNLARAGVDFTLPAKRVRIDEIVLLASPIKEENTYSFKIRCGGGTYIRSIARDMATALQTHAVMSGLRRTQSGYFHIQDAIPFSALETDPDISTLERYMIPTEKVLSYPDLRLTDKLAERVLNGLAVEADEQDGLYKLYINDVFYGIAEIKDGKAKAKTKLC